MKVRGKDMGILVDGPILYDHLVTILNLNNLFQAVIEEVHLEIERPTGHVLIEVVEVRIVLHILEPGFPIIMFGQLLRKRGFACTYVTGYCNMLDVVRLTDSCKF